MNKIEINDKWMHKTSVVWLGSMLCCLLWGSAFPCIGISRDVPFVPRSVPLS